MARGGEEEEEDQFSKSPWEMRGGDYLLLLGWSQVASLTQGLARHISHLTLIATARPWYSPLNTSPAPARCEYIHTRTLGVSQGTRYWVQGKPGEMLLTSGAQQGVPVHHDIPGVREGNNERGRE